MCDSRDSSLGVVPEETSEWKPEMAAQAMVMKQNGKTGPANTGPVPYNVSKAGVWMLTKVAARVLAPTGIRVNAIGPGYVETNMTSMIADYPDDYREAFMRQIPMGRLGRPEEIAATASFLASDDSSYFTGELLHPDGGYFTD